MTDLPTGTITFLFTDIEGSTALWESHRDSMQGALAQHHAIVREAIESNGGHAFNIVGDAFCAAFATAPEALAAALATQRALQTASWGETLLRVRIGLHTGSAVAIDDDYRSGPTLNRVARVMSLAHGGQILLSQTTADLVRGEATGVTLRDMGLHRLKGLHEPEQILQVVVPDLPSDFRPLASSATVPNNLPVQLTSFIGREKEMYEVKRLLASSRLVSLTGSGGTGKTRLSLRVAADMLDACKDGVWFVELAPLADPALVPIAVASVLGVREEEGRPFMVTLLDWFRTRQLLLVLDNCEHLIDACARFADAVLHASREMRILASSREALGIAGETAYRVPSLDVAHPNARISLAQLEQYAAMRLFVERAQSAQPHFALSAANAATVGQICYRLDGIPLAIELAAARVKALPVEKIAERLDDRFRLLTGGSRTALPRQQTLRAAIDWSNGLLSEPERVLLRRLSVFSGGWTLEAAEAVCAGDSIETVDMLDLLTHLVDKSLVVLDEQAFEPRYRMLETIRQYAREKLSDSEQAAPLRDKHLRHFVRFGLEIEPGLFGKDLVFWLNRLETEIDNVRAALDWATDTGQAEAGMKLASSAFWWWNVRGRQAEGLQRLQALLGLPSAAAGDGTRARAVMYAGMICWRIGNHDRAFELYTEALEIAREIHDQRIIARVSLNFAPIYNRAGDYRLADAMYESALGIWQALQDRYWISIVKLQIGGQALVRHQYDLAQERLAEGIAGMLEFGDPNILSFYYRSWGTALMHLGDTRAARAKIRESLTLNLTIGDKQAVAACFSAFAATAIKDNDMRRAARLLGAADTVCESIRTKMLPWDFEWYTQNVATARAQLDPISFEAAWTNGTTLTLDEAVALALEGTDG